MNKDSASLINQITFKSGIIALVFLYIIGNSICSISIKHTSQFVVDLTHLCDLHSLCNQNKCEYTSLEFNNCPTRCELFSLLYFCRQLYMFWVLTPINRNSNNCNYSFWY